MPRSCASIDGAVLVRPSRGGDIADDRPSESRPAPVEERLLPPAPRAPSLAIRLAAIVFMHAAERLDVLVGGAVAGGGERVGERRRALAHRAGGDADVGAAEHRREQRTTWSFCCMIGGSCVLKSASRTDCWNLSPEPKRSARRASEYSPRRRTTTESDTHAYTGVSHTSPYRGSYT